MHACVHMWRADLIRLISIDGFENLKELRIRDCVLWEPQHTAASRKELLIVPHADVRKCTHMCTVHTLMCVHMCANACA